MFFLRVRTSILQWLKRPNRKHLSTTQLTSSVEVKEVPVPDNCKRLKFLVPEPDKSNYAASLNILYPGKRELKPTARYSQVKGYAALEKVQAVKVSELQEVDEPTFSKSAFVTVLDICNQLKDQEEMSSLWEKDYLDSVEALTPKTSPSSLFLSKYPEGTSARQEEQLNDVALKTSYVYCTAN